MDLHKEISGNDRRLPQRGRNGEVVIPPGAFVAMVKRARTSLLLIN